jgi:hypothetical protein
MKRGPLHPSHHFRVASRDDVAMEGSIGKRLSDADGEPLVGWLVTWYWFHLNCKRPLYSPMSFAVLDGRSRRCRHVHSAIRVRRGGHVHCHGAAARRARARLARHAHVLQERGGAGGAGDRPAAGVHGGVAAAGRGAGAAAAPRAAGGERQSRGVHPRAGSFLPLRLSQLASAAQAAEKPCWGESGPTCMWYYSREYQTGRGVTLPSVQVQGMVHNSADSSNHTGCWAHVAVPNHTFSATVSC